MKRVFATALAALLAGSAGGFGPGVASGDPAFPWPPPTPSPVGAGATAGVVYAVGGARPPGIPWYEYTSRAGSGYFPNARRDIIEYPAGALYSWVPQEMFPGPRDNMTVGQAIQQATDNLDQAIRNGTEPAATVGLSQGNLALDQEQVRLANDPKAPPPDTLQFTTIGDPVGTHGFGASFASGIFKPGDRIPIIDYTMPAPVDSQYDTNKIVAAYDGFADFPDRPDNLLADVNALLASAIVHTPAAFTGPGDVPPQNIRTGVNPRGAKTTTYLVPVNHLPLTLPLRYLGWSDGLVNQIDAALQPQIDAGYSRNDNLFTRPVSVDPVNGMDPVGILGPGTRDSVENFFAQIRAIVPPPG
ncbi:PE-PPE domain-containing protein [Mycobacterium colombiense]|uniref:PE-PPE domain-containing protein n=1 Tax=Mycobacterium colombiense TaxID=339268 RepID=UPI00096D50C6|nr:PE-PPE domain-containing protein [Mycobacterium colombiense]OMC19432.1 PE-PPE domain-containing protein [Mycobacterium colombiense]